MINLIKLELFKEIKKKSFIISIFLILFTSFFVSYFVSKEEKVLNSEIYIIEEKLSEEEFNNLYKLSSYDNYLVQYKEYLSVMKDRIKLQSYNNLSKTKNIFNQTFNIQVFLMMLISFVGSSIVSYEINKGSIKTLITSSYSKTKILFSKLICLVLIALFFNILLLLFMSLFASIMGSENILSLKEYIVLNSSISEVNYYLHSLKTFGMFLLPTLFICFLSIFLSVCFNGNIGSVISISIPLVGNIVSQILFGFNINFIEYTFLPYMDFSIFNDELALIYSNMELGININLKSGIIILTLFSLIFYCLSNLIFNKKDLV